MKKYMVISKYETKDGLNATIGADDSNNVIKLKIFNRYGYLILESHFSYWYGDPVKNAKDSLEAYDASFFRVG